MRQEPRRKTPEELLKQCQAEEAAVAKRGHLKIVLGYASGVGKSFRMFDEARRRRERGQDIVVGALQPQPPPEGAAFIRDVNFDSLIGLSSGRRAASAKRLPHRQSRQV